MLSPCCLWFVVPPINVDWLNQSLRNLFLFPHGLRVNSLPRGCNTNFSFKILKVDTFCFNVDNFKESKVVISELVEIGYKLQKFEGHLFSCA
jgi:hypothetical protein